MFSLLKLISYKTQTLVIMALRVAVSISPILLYIGCGFSQSTQCGVDCSTCDGFPLSCLDSVERCEFDPSSMLCNYVGGSCGSFCDQCDGNQTACLGDPLFCQWVPNPINPSTNNGVCAPIDTCQSNCELCDNTECTPDGAGGYGACQVLGGICEGVTCDTNCDECTGDGMYNSRSSCSSGSALTSVSFKSSLSSSNICLL